jgi:hypothetical protein
MSRKAQAAQTVTCFRPLHTATSMSAAIKKITSLTNDAPGTLIGWPICCALTTPPTTTAVHMESKQAAIRNCISGSSNYVSSERFVDTAAVNKRVYFSECDNVLDAESSLSTVDDDVAQLMQD